MLFRSHRTAVIRTAFRTALLLLLQLLRRETVRRFNALDKVHKARARIVRIGATTRLQRLGALCRARRVTRLRRPVLATLARRTARQATAVLQLGHLVRCAASAAFQALVEVRTETLARFLEVVARVGFALGECCRAIIKVLRIAAFRSAEWCWWWRRCWSWRW